MKYEFVFDFLLMTCSSGKHSIMFRGGGSGCRAGWVVVLQGKSQKHESEINYSSVIIFRRGGGVGSLHALYQAFLSPFYVHVGAERAKL